MSEPIEQPRVMCSPFQLVDFGPKPLDTEIRIHARLRTMRLGRWNVVGVFQFTAPEWDAFKACCIQLGIEIVQASEVGE